MNNKYNNLCDLVKKTKLSKSDCLGKGSCAEAYNFKIENDNTEYALKVISSEILYFNYDDCKRRQFTYVAKDKKKYTYKKCHTFYGKTIKDVSFIEYAISRLASNTGSENFLNANSIGLYKSESESKEESKSKNKEESESESEVEESESKDKTYILMEKADGILEDFFKKISEEDMISIIIQIMHAIYLMNELKIQHNDLHPGNIFLKENKEVGRIMTLKVGEDSFSVPIGKYIAKIGDWGLANCFDEDNAILNNQLKMRGFPVPDYYCPAYDIGYFIGRLYYGSDIKNSFITKIKEWIGNGLPLWKENANENFFRRVSGDFFLNMDIRKVNEDFPHVTAVNFFKLEIMNKFKLSFDSNENLMENEQQKIKNNTPKRLKYASTKLRNDRDFILSAVKQDGYNLIYASTELQNDKEIVLAAVSKIGFILLDASLSLQNNKNVILAVIKQDKSVINFVSKELQNDFDIMNKLNFSIKKNKINDHQKIKNNINKITILKHLGDKLRNDRDFILSAVKQDGYNLIYASTELQNDKEIVLAAVKQDGNALLDASLSLQNDKDVVLAAIKQDKSVIIFASKELQNDPDVIFAAK